MFRMSSDLGVLHLHPDLLSPRNYCIRRLVAFTAFTCQEGEDIDVASAEQLEHEGVHGSAASKRCKARGHVRLLRSPRNQSAEHSAQAVASGGFPTNQPTNLLAMASNPRVNDEANWENPSKTINTSYEHKSHKSANHHPGLAQQEPFVSAGGQGGERSCPTMDMDHDRSGSSQDLRRSKTTDPIG